MKNRIVAAGIVVLLSCSLCPDTHAGCSLMAVATLAGEGADELASSQDLTTALTITRSGFRIDRKTGQFVQTIELKNSQAVPITGPLYFVVAGLSSGVTVVHAGSTQNLAPAGSPYITLHTADGNTFQPGERVSLTIQFENQNRVPINYTPKVFSTLTTP